MGTVRKRLMQKPGLGAKFNLLITFLLSLSIGSVGYYLLQKERSNQIHISFDTVKKDVRLQGSEIQNAIFEMINDVKFLAKTPPIQGIIRTAKGNGIDPLDGSTQELWRERLAVIFKEFLGEKSRYLQLRYIGKQGNGREIVRVENNSGKISMVGKADLQSKGNRPYFQEAIKVSANEVHLSPITLNREYEKIAEPHVAVMRAAVPIYDPQGDVFGIVVINMNFGPILTSLIKANKHLTIVNENGDYLAHQDPKRAFGFELGERHRAQDSIPQLGRLFEKGNTDREFSYSSPDNNEDRTFLWKQTFDPGNNVRFIGLLHRENFSEGWESSRLVYGEIILLISGLLVISLLLGFYFTRRLTSPLEQITTAAEKFSHGEFSAPLETKTKDEIGALAKAFNLMVDERKRQENALINERQNLYAMLDNLPMAFHLQAADYSVPYANKWFHEVFGNPEGRMCYELMHKRNEPCETCGTFTIFETGETYQSTWRSFNGCVYHTVATPFKDTDGTPLVMEMVVDVTEQKKAEEELRNSHKQLRDLCSHLENI
ncbi:hypothetical protein UR09_06155, partial [Candidatus Nitromaritima sp. SCGC AAA799-A02]